MRISPTGIEESGFTLLELVLVVAIFGLCFGVAMPNWQGRRQETALRLASSQLAQLCRYGLSLAASGKQELELLWNGEEFQLRLEGAEEAVEEYRLPRGFSYQGPQRLSLPPDAMLEEEVLLVLKSGGESYIVQLDSGGIQSYPGGRGNG